MYCYLVGYKRAVVDHEDDGTPKAVLTEVFAQNIKITTHVLCNTVEMAQALVDKHMEGYEGYLPCEGWYKRGV